MAQRGSVRHYLGLTGDVLTCHLCMLQTATAPTLFLFWRTTWDGSKTMRRLISPIVAPSLLTICLCVCSDLTYNNPTSPIPTPEIDSLARSGVVLTQHYSHSLCTPSRAALLTGRYHINTGLHYVLAPGTPAGLPADIPTLPMLLRRDAGYRAEMVGKWHLGHAFASQTPTGRGFQRFTGIYMWDTDSYDKTFTELPWDSPIAVDWVREEVVEDGAPVAFPFLEDQQVRFTHYAEPRHATEAIAREAVAAMERHVAEHSAEPLFLYVAFTAAHSPLQPLPRHTTPCEHIPHSWRRDFCGVVGGLDEAVGNVTRAARATLGENTVFIFASDNGGSPWFGGNNQPLRGSKATPLEGGVKTPSFLVDFSANQRFFGGGDGGGGDGAARCLAEAEFLPRYHHGTDQRVFAGLFHISDWLPTLLALAGAGPEGSDVDGVNMLPSLRAASSGGGDCAGGEGTTARNEMLIELYDAENFAFGESLAAYRYGRYKLVDGIVRDDASYFESRVDRLNCSETSLLRSLTETVNRGVDWLFGAAKADLLRITLTHVILQDQLTRPQKLGLVPTRRLFDLAQDPLEETNLLEHWSQFSSQRQEELANVVAHMTTKIGHFRRNMRRPQPAHRITPLDEWRQQTRVAGDCSANPHIPASHCGFTHPWLNHSASVEDWDEDVFRVPGLLSISDHSVLRARDMMLRGAVSLLLLSLLVTLLRLCFGRIPKPAVVDAGDKKKKKDKKKDSDGVAESKAAKSKEE